MMHKTFIVTICLLFDLAQAWGQTETIVHFSKSDKIVQAKAYRFSIYSSSDTLNVFTASDNKVPKHTSVSVQAGNDTLIAAFEYSNDSIKWYKVEYPIALDKALKRLEIKIHFSANNQKVEYLQDFTVNKFYTTDRVSLQADFKKQIGEALKRLEIKIHFSANNQKVEYLQDFTVNKFYTTDRVSLQADFKKQIGEAPSFKMVSH